MVGNIKLEITLIYPQKYGYCKMQHISIKECIMYMNNIQYSSSLWDSWGTLHPYFFFFKMERIQANYPRNCEKVGKALHIRFLINIFFNIHATRVHCNLLALPRPLARILCLDSL